MQHFLLVNNPFTKGNQGPMERWLILELGQEIYKISLKHLVMPESKELLKTTQINGVMSKGQRIQLKELLMAKAGPV